MDDAGELVEANGIARTLLAATERTLLSELCEAVARARAHDGWTWTRVEAGKGRLAHLFTVRASSVGEDSRRLVAEAATAWRLTSRQREVLERVVEGHANRTISALLGIAERTVEAHLTAVFEKASVSSRAALIGRVFVWSQAPSGVHDRVAR